VFRRCSATKGWLHILSSDYAPISLLYSAFLLHSEIAMPLSDAVAKVSRNPAASLGLVDRGEQACPSLAHPYRRWHARGAAGVARRVWRAGERVV
jgi:alpha-D-ribose 1-methylphosphonate 5-triphosphate diphosphatase